MSLLSVYSKFQEYLRGFLWALSDDAQTISETLHVLESTVQQQTRFSKHGKYFSPFSQVLRSTLDTHSMYPMLMAVPFLDWSVLDKTPPLRFQVDRREGFRSARSSVHMLRSVLQYFYRLEETADRESSQVFAKHKPWSTDRELDLKVRQWYGHYPTALNVDELWVLVMDPSHIVTFSSNQTWKSRSPPLQLTSRITDIAFRGIRNAYFTSQQNDGYTAMTHAIVSLSGAIGMMHKSFWLDLTLPSIDRYAGHLSHLQYRLHRSPSTKLVMDLIAFQDEISIVIQVTQRQVEMVSALQKQVNEAIDKNDVEARPSDRQAASTERNESLLNAAHARATYRQLSSSSVADPIVQLLENLLRELTDLQELRDNCDRLVTRTIQLVNIRLEDHGKAILVFTVVTIVFLPLNFVSSFFGMNFRDIRNMQQTQWLFWAVALCVTAGVLGISIFLAFSGGTIMENLLAYRDKRRELQLSSSTVSRQARYRSEEQGFRVLGTTGQTDGMNLMAGPAG